MLFVRMSGPACDSEHESNRVQPVNLARNTRNLQAKELFHDDWCSLLVMQAK